MATNHCRAARAATRIPTAPPNDLPAPSGRVLALLDADRLRRFIRKQLDEFQALHARLERLQDDYWRLVQTASPGAAAAARGRAVPPENACLPLRGHFLYIPALQQFHRELDLLVGQSRTLLASNRGRLDQTLSCLERLDRVPARPARPVEERAHD